MKAYCLQCKLDTNHEVLKEEKRDYSNEEEGLWAEQKFQIIQCKGCEHISFQEVSLNSDDTDPEDGTLYERKKNYPLPNKGSIVIKNYYNVPFKVRNIYREVIDAYNNGMYVLCAAGLRAIIEGICNQEGITSGLVEIIKDDKPVAKRKSDLQGKISGLFEKGFLTKKHSDLLHEHRLLGNEAIHTLDNPTKDELTLAIEIVEHTLDNIYEMDEKVEDLRYKRALRLKKKNNKYT